MSSHILAFSDLHGRIPLMLRTVWQFQQERGVAVGLVLVSGDLGVWPDLSALDSSTRKRCQSDPTELDFHCFTPLAACGDQPSPLIDAAHWKRSRRLLDKILPEIHAKVLFVGGNHEDYDYLEACRRAAPAQHAEVPIETGGLLFWLPPGRIYRHREATITGLSGIDAAACGRDPQRYHVSAIVTGDRADEATLQAMEQLEDQSADIYLSHDGLPDAARSGKGTTALLEPLLALNPRYHFFGHYHSEVDPVEYRSWLPKIVQWHPQIAQRLDDIAKLRTTGIHINKLDFGAGTGRLRRHSVGLLSTTQAGRMDFTFVEDEWLDEISEKNYLRRA